MKQKHTEDMVNTITKIIDAKLYDYNNEFWKKNPHPFALTEPEMALIAFSDPQFIPKTIAKLKKCVKNHVNFYGAIMQYAKTNHLVVIAVAKRSKHHQDYRLAAEEYMKPFQVMKNKIMENIQNMTLPQIIKAIDKI